jgi:hypothetical protein
MAWFMPTLNPASVAEYLSFGEYGYALSRFSGMWVGFKTISETVESCASVELLPRRVFHPPAFEPPPGGLRYLQPGFTVRRSSIDWKRRRGAGFCRRQSDRRRIYDIPTTWDQSHGQRSSRPDGPTATGALEARMEARHRHLQGGNGVAVGASTHWGRRETRNLVIEENAASS